MLYKSATILGDEDWGYFIDVDDIPLKQVSHKIVEQYYTATTPFCLYQWLSETYIMALEIPRKSTIKDSCICSTFVTTFTLGSIMLCFII
jgi:hypothetical protein